LPKDTSYLWIDSLALRGAQGTARGVIIPGTAGLAAAIRRIRVEHHPETGVRGWPEARLLFDPEDDEVWESCVVFGCCYLEGGVPGGGG
ncbi:MAG TPA: hypothetical protein VFH97_03400, partial [Gemmatimonadales bacterium]|nr:hypothetical protein [Gemmatimonadales bacterium]